MWRLFCKSCGAPFVVSAVQFVPAERRDAHTLTLACPVCMTRNAYGADDFVGSNQSPAAGSKAAGNSK